VSKQIVLKSKNPPYLKEGRPIGWFDGAAQRRGQISGAGGVIRVNNHTKYRWMLNCGPGTNTRAELLGVWALLTLAIRLHIYDLQCLGTQGL
jgi:ribonuclease HI